MRVAIDFRVLGTDAALRGLGRYTQQQVFEALRTDPELEVFLLLQDRLDPARRLYFEPAAAMLHNLSVHIFHSFSSAPITRH